MAGDRDEPNRVFGVPLGGPDRDRQGEEPQRVLGFPVDWFWSAPDSLRPLAHPIRGLRRWARRRRLGPYAPDDGDQDKPGC